MSNLSVDSLYNRRNQQSASVYLVDQHICMLIFLAVLPQRESQIAGLPCNLPDFMRCHGIHTLESKTFGTNLLWSQSTSHVR